MHQKEIEVKDLLTRHKYDEAVGMIDDLIESGEITIARHPKLWLLKARAYEQKALLQKEPSCMSQYSEECIQILKDLIQANKSYESNEDVAHCFSVSYFRAEHYSDAEKWYTTAARLAKRKGKSGAKFSFLAKHYQQHADKASELQKEIDNSRTVGYTNQAVEENRGQTKQNGAEQEAKQKGAKLKGAKKKGATKAAEGEGATIAAEDERANMPHSIEDKVR